MNGGDSVAVPVRARSPPGSLRSSARPHPSRDDDEQRGELSAVIKRWRRFPGVTDNAPACKCARTIATGEAAAEAATAAITAGALTQAGYFRWSLTRADTKAQWPLMTTITWVYALLAFVLAANAVVAFAAIARLEEPHGPRPR